ncbi:MAG: hypothetical protein ABJF23_14210 [Bryobacteraceae bacterium]
MKNWKALAEAYELAIPESEMDRIAVPLNGLEESFRKLAAAFPADTDSALTFDVSPEAK